MTIDSGLTIERVLPGAGRLDIEGEWQALAGGKGLILKRGCNNLPATEPICVHQLHIEVAGCAARVLYCHGYLECPVYRYCCLMQDHALHYRRSRRCCAGIKFDGKV